MNITATLCFPLCNNDLAKIMQLHVIAGGDADLFFENKNVGPPRYASDTEPKVSLLSKRDTAKLERFNDKTLKTGSTPLLDHFDKLDKQTSGKSFGRKGSTPNIIYEFLVESGGAVERKKIVDYLQQNYGLERSKIHNRIGAILYNPAYKNKFAKDGNMIRVLETPNPLEVKD